MSKMCDIKYAKYEIRRVKRLLLKCHDMMEEMNALSSKEVGDFYGLISKCNQIIESLKQKEISNAN